VSAPHPGRFYPQKRPSNHCTGVCVGLRAGLNGVATGIQSRTDQPVASRYTDWATGLSIINYQLDNDILLPNSLHTVWVKHCRKYPDSHKQCTYTYLKGVRIYFHNLCHFYGRNSNPDLQKKNSDALTLDSTTLPWPLNLERCRRVGGWTHHEGTYHLLRERERYFVRFVSPVTKWAWRGSLACLSRYLSRGRHSPFRHSLQQRIPYTQMLFQKKKKIRLIIWGSGLHNVTLSHSDLPVSTVTPSSQDISRRKRRLVIAWEIRPLKAFVSLRIVRRNCSFSVYGKGPVVRRVRISR